jgi:ribosomal protein S18 acetylase RimI-like enzyme
VRIGTLAAGSLWESDVSCPNHTRWLARLFPGSEPMSLCITLDDTVDEAEVLDLYRANNWSSADKPQQLMAALSNSHSLVTARIESRLVGLGNAISDGHLVVYYPHLLVHPAFQRKGIGKKMMQTMQAKYSQFHQQILVADENAMAFYRTLGFESAGRTQSMWIYAGMEH